MTASTGCHVPDTSTTMAMQSTETTTEPLSTETTSKPLSVDTTAEPLSTETISELPSVYTTAEPLSTETISEPPSVYTTAEPLSTETTSEQPSSETTSEQPSVDTTAEPLSTETTLAAITTKPASLCRRTELGSSEIKRSGSFYLLKRNVIVDNLNDLIVTVNVSKKKECAIACFEDDGCLTFVFREMGAGPSLCSLFKTLTPQHVVVAFNSDLYAIKCQ